MEVERIDVFDFKTVLSEKEFHILVLISDKLNITIQQSFAEICSMGLVELQRITELKE